VGRILQIAQDTVWKERSTHGPAKLCERPSSESRRFLAVLPNPQRAFAWLRTIVAQRNHARWGAEGLPEDTIELHFTGSAGQSFGAFIPKE